MAKRLSQSTQSNTLLNYFQSPKAKQMKTNVEEKKDIPEDDSDEEITATRKKRTRILAMHSDDSDSENVETPSASRTPKKFKFKAEKRSEKHMEETQSSSKLQKFAFGQDSETPSTSTKSGIKPKSFSTNKEEGQKSSRWLHETLSFLKENKIMDANKHKFGDPEYDARTLYVPMDYLKTLTPAMRQWWELKSQNYDTVLFFKVGKFYELYHMDATVGVECLGFSYMKGEFAHSGFPEIAFDRMSSSLIQQGYKVGRVEQTETPEMMVERCKTIKPTKFDKVVKRELCQVSTKGVALNGVQTLDPQQSQGSYLIAICEFDTHSIWKHFGVCFIEVSVGLIYMAEFDDDKWCSRLLTLMAQHEPGLILVERGGMENDTMQIITVRMKECKKEFLKPGKEFPSADSVVDNLKREWYFKNKEDKLEWPELFNELLLDLSDYPKKEYYNCIRSLGACIWYLKKSLIDMQVLSTKKFKMYVPIDLAKPDDYKGMKYMVFDRNALENLNILGGEKSLQKTLDFCCTNFGKRLFHSWICQPLCDVSKIEKRQAAVEELYNDYDLLSNTRDLLSKLPDLERQIIKIRRFGNAHVAQHHPDSRAILYESKTYSKRKIQDLMSTLEGFERFSIFTEMFANCKSKLLRKITQTASGGSFVDLSDHLKFFRDAFDHMQAKEEGTILPKAGVDEDYDDSQAQITEIQNELENYLDKQRHFFKCDVKYFGTEKKRFQLEIPENKCDRVTSQYQLESTKKGSKPCKRYSTTTTKRLLAQMMKAEADRAKIVQDLNRRVFEKFGQREEDWDKALSCVTILDCICSLAEYARLHNEDMCIPKVLPFSDKPVCHMENARHPCISTYKSNFVPNDVQLGRDKQPIMILTGPNMGGKSTFMRQTVLISIMAQIGSYVPASYCEVSLIDRIFTRMGAHDDIMKGQSTFLVEMMEASSILRHANHSSFVLLDELGRGTSTHDGNAIARAYVRELSNIKCRAIFATHYHSLVQKFDDNESIQLGYMTCMLENEGEENERVIFLYKVAQGLWPKSYGFYVASLAGMPKSIVSSARKFATIMELRDQNRNIVRNLDNITEIMKLLATK